MKKKPKWTQRFPEWKMGLIWTLLFATACLFVPRFFDLRNLMSILVQMAPVGIIAVGMTFVILTAGIDLSVGSLVAMISVLMVGSGTLPFPLMVILALFWGLVAGALNGGLIGIFKMSPFIVTLSTMAMAKGVALWISNTEEKVITDPTFAWLGSGEILGVPVPIVLFLSVVLMAQLVLSKTVFGRRVFAVGSNASAALHAGIDVSEVRFWVYVISGVLTSIGALVVSARLQVSTPSLGEFYELDAIAAVIIGGTSLFGGRGSVIGTLIGVLIFGTITNVLNLSGASPHAQRIAKGLIILLAVAMQSDQVHAAFKSCFRFWRKSTRKEPMSSSA